VIARGISGKQDRDNDACFEAGFTREYGDITDLTPAYLCFFSLGLAIPLVSRAWDESDMSYLPISSGSTSEAPPDSDDADVMVDHFFR
jgi:hypothetical protein